MFVIKFAFKEDIRRVTVDRVQTLNELEELAQSLYKDSLPKPFSLRYKDDEGDLITVTSDRELEEAFRLFRDPSILRIIVQSSNIPRNSPPSFSTSSESKEENIMDVFNLSPFLEAIGVQLKDVCPKIEEQVGEFLPKIEETLSAVFGNNSNPSTPSSPHRKVVHPAICDNCKKRIIGIRWKCTVCPDYDLCEVCKDIGTVHSEHEFAKFEFSVRGPKCGCPVLQKENQCCGVKSGVQIPITRENNNDQVKTPGSASPQILKPLTPLRIIKTEEPKKEQQEEEVKEPAQILKPLTPLRIIKVEEPKKEEEVKVELPKVEEPVVVTPVEEKKEESPFESKLKQLEEMGFFDRARNIELLIQHKGDMISVVRYLLE